MKNNKSAFPVRNRWDSGNESFDLEDAGMTLKAYAAIRLKVPRSGDLELDAMIRESVRRDFAEKALVGNVFGENVHDKAALAVSCYKVADAMLAEWENGK
jgi:hypothetical protein